MLLVKRNGHGRTNDIIPQQVTSGLSAPAHIFLRGMGYPQCYAYCGRSMSTTKQDVEHLLNKLPDNSSVEDIQYHLYVLDKVRRGLDDARVSGALSHDEVENRLSKWLTE